MTPRFRYKAFHERGRERVLVRIVVWQRGVPLAIRETSSMLPRETATKDIHRYKQVMAELERQKDLDKT